MATRQTLNVSYCGLYFYNFALALITVCVLSARSIYLFSAHRCVCVGFFKRFRSRSLHGPTEQMEYSIQRFVQFLPILMISLAFFGWWTLKWRKKSTALSGFVEMFTFVTQTAINVLELFVWRRKMQSQLIFHGIAPQTAHIVWFVTY